MDKLHEILKGGENVAKKKDEVFEYEAQSVDFESHLIDSWDYEVDGESYHIDKGGTPVPADKADAIVHESKKTGAPLRKV